MYQPTTYFDDDASAKQEDPIDSPHQLHAPAKQPMQARSTETPLINDKEQEHLPEQQHHHQSYHQQYHQHHLSSQPPSFPQPQPPSFSSTSKISPASTSPSPKDTLSSTTHFISTTSLQIITSLNSRSFNLTSPTLPWIHFLPETLIQLSTDAHLLTLPKIFSLWEAIYAQNPEYHLSVEDYDTIVNWEAKPPVAEVFLNLKKHGWPVGVVRPVVLKVLWKFVGGKERWMVWDVHAVEGPGGIHAIC